jgi:hypothetical protein
MECKTQGIGLSTRMYNGTSTSPKNLFVLDLLVDGQVLLKLPSKLVIIYW